MKKILIPFDFTEVSLKAMEYGFEAFKDEAKFVILHIVDGNLDLNDPLTYTASLTRADALAEEMHRLAKERQEALGFEVDYITQVETGSVVEILVDNAEKEGFDGIVMGTRDKYDVFDKLFGTVSLGVVKRARIPVYLIPKSATFSSYDKVVIAADYHLEKDDILDALVEWNKKYRADFHFLHLMDGKGRNEGFAENIVEEFFEKRQLDFPFSIIQREGKGVAKEVINYATEKNMDLQIIITDKMSWLDTITSRSVSKAMILKASRPILFIHSGARKRSQIFFEMAAI